MSTLARSVERRLDEAARRAEKLAPGPALDMVGRVESIGDDVAMVSGLPQTRLNELLLFEREGGGPPATAMVLALDPGLIGCAMLDVREGIGQGAGCAEPVRWPAYRLAGCFWGGWSTPSVFLSMAAPNWWAKASNRSKDRRPASSTAIT